MQQNTPQLAAWVFYFETKFSFIFKKEKNNHNFLGGRKWH